MTVRFSGARRQLGVFVLVVCISMCIPACVFGLSPRSAYEMVSPIYKGGYAVSGIDAVGVDGGSTALPPLVVFASLGAFAGDPLNNGIKNDYVATRGTAGWSTAPLSPPSALLPYGAVADFSATLDSSLIEGKPGPNAGAALYASDEFEYLLHQSAPDEAGNFEVAGLALHTLSRKPMTLSYQSASSEFSHIVFLSTGADYLLPEAVGTNSSLYDLATQVSGGVPSLRLVGLNNKGKVINPECRASLGTDAGKGSAYNAIAADGNEIFFKTSVGSDCIGQSQVFVRVSGSRTLEVSRPVSPKCVEVPCAGAGSRAPSEFQGASKDGSVVFFTTSEPLANTDKDGGNDLYMARIGCIGGEAVCPPSMEEVTSLVQVSHAAEAAEVQGVTVVADDGSRVYFVARGILSGGVNAEGASAIKGADNLYMYDSSSGGAPTFVGDLCSASEESGIVEDGHCPSNLTSGPGTGSDTNLWLSGSAEVQTTEDGRFLVFSTYAQLAETDTDAGKDVYRFDAQTGRLDRVSVGEAGYGINGNGECGDIGCDATIALNTQRHAIRDQRDMYSRAVSSDGSRVVFKTVEPLSPNAVNGLANVYEWQEGSSGGRVSLVSSGSSDDPVENVVISGTGEDVFFTTSQGLVSADTDNVADLYDARLGGGFPEAGAPASPCSGDACQGPLTNPAPLLLPGSVSQTPGGNFATPVVKKAVSKRKKPVKRSIGKIKRKAKNKRRGRSPGSRQQVGSRREGK